MQNDGTYKKVEIEQPQDKNIFLQNILGSGTSHQDKAHTLTASYNKAVIWNTLENTTMPISRNMTSKVFLRLLRHIL